MDFQKLESILLKATVLALFFVGTVFSVAGADTYQTTSCNDPDGCDFNIDTGSGKLLLVGHSSADTGNNCDWTFNANLDGSTVASSKEGDSDSSVFDNQAIVTLRSVSAGTHSINVWENHECSPNWKETRFSAVFVSGSLGNAGTDRCNDPDGCSFNVNTGSGKLLVLGHSSASTGNNCDWTFNVDVDGSRRASVKEGDSDTSVSDNQFFSTLVNVNSGSHSIDASEGHECSPNWRETQVVGIEVPSSVASAATSCNDPDGCDFSLNSGGAPVLLTGHSSASTGNNDDWTFNINVDGSTVASSKEGDSDTSVSDTQGLATIVGGGNLNINTWESHENSPNWRETQVSAVSLNAPPSVSNPRPAQATSTSPVNSQSPQLKVDVSDSNGDSVDVKFYNADASMYASGANLVQWDHPGGLSDDGSDGADSAAEFNKVMDDGPWVNGKYGETTVGQIACETGTECNLFASSDTYSTCITGYIYAPESGTYSFATDSDDASDFYVDVPTTSFDHCDSLGSDHRVVSWYGAHGESDNWNHNGQVSLSKGYHTFIYRMSDRGGADSYTLGWMKPSDSSYSVVPSSNFYHRTSGWVKIADKDFQNNYYGWNSETGNIQIRNDQNGNPWLAAGCSTSYQTNRISKQLDDMGLSYSQVRYRATFAALDSWDDEYYRNQLLTDGSWSTYYSTTPHHDGSNYGTYEDFPTLDCYDKFDSPQGAYNVEKTFSASQVTDFRLRSGLNQDDHDESMALKSLGVWVNVSGSNPLIGTDTVSGSGTASATWSGLQCGKTYNWYVEADDGSTTTKSSTWTFSVTCNKPPQVQDLVFKNSTTDHEYSVTANIYDPDGSGDIQSCDLEATSGGNTVSYPMSIDTAYGNSSEAQCNYQWVNYQDGPWTHLATTDVTVTATDSDGNTQTVSGKNTFPNHDPTVSSFSYENYSTRHAFNVSTVVFDSDSNKHELDRCEYTFTDTDGNSYSRTVPVNVDYGAEDQGLCHYSEINDTQSVYSGFEVTEPIDVGLTVYDDHSGTGSGSSTHNIPNQLPDINLVSPQDDSSVSGDVIDLQVDVSDMEDSPLKVWFFNQDTGEVLGYESLSSGIADTSWDDVVSGQTYEWFVNVSDSYQNSTSATWSFLKVTSKSFRTRTELEYEYSTVITATGSRAYIDMTVTNLVSETKDMYTSLSGVDARFLENNQDSISYTLEGGEKKTFQIEITPSTVGDQTLQVITENTELGTRNVDTFPVYVTETDPGEREVPGPGYIQLVLLALLAGAVYFRLVEPGTL